VGDLENDTHRTNALRTMERLIGLGIVPIVNENDTVATQEIRFGDNDRLAALVSELVGADVLVLLSDVDALYTKPPGEPGAMKIDTVPFGDDLSHVELGAAMVNSVGTGGAVTKVSAARMATQAGIATLLTATDSIGLVLEGEAVGTWFEAADLD
jgi:glutamate 5-kinase